MTTFLACVLLHATPVAIAPEAAEASAPDALPSDAGDPPGPDAPPPAEAPSSGGAGPPAADEATRHSGDAPSPDAPTTAAPAPGSTAPVPSDPFGPPPEARKDASVDAPEQPTPAAFVPPEAPVAASSDPDRAPIALPDLRFRVDLGPSLIGTVPSDSGYLAFDDDRNWVGGGAFARADGALGRGRWFLGGGISYHRARSESSTEGVVSRLLVDQVLFHVRLSARPVEGIDVFVDGAAGPSMFSAEIASAVTDLGVESDSTEFTARGVAGIALYMPRKWLGRRPSRVTAGIETGLGYQYAGQVSVDGDPEVDEGAIETQAPAFGNVTTRGFTWHLAFFVRLM